MSTIEQLQTRNLESFYQLLRILETYGDLPAVWTSDRSVTYSYHDLAVTIQKFATLLSGQIQPADRVILTDLQGPHWVVAFFAVLLNKAIAVPIDQRMSLELQTEIQELVGATTLITCNSETQTTLKKIVFEKQTLPDVATFNASFIEPNTPAEIIFTSGTWGKPKGVTLSHRNILSNTTAVLEAHRPNRGSTFLSVLPLSHAYEQVPGLLAPLASGSHIVYQNALDSFSLLASMQLHKPNYMVVVPRFLEILQTRITEKKSFKIFIQPLLALSTFIPIWMRRLLFHSLHKRFGGKLHTFTIGGAPLSLEIEQFFQALGFKFIVGYGLSESSPVLTIFQANRRPKNCVGQALLGVNISIAEDGEIIARGPNIFLGYWPLTNTEPVASLYTGDLGYIDADNKLFLTGRKKNMVVFPSGDKIQLEDIELFAQKIPGLIESCALAIDQPDSQLKLGIIYIGTISPENLLTAINKKLPLFGRLHFAKQWPEEKLPRSHLLKLQRNTIQKWYEAI